MLTVTANPLPRLSTPPLVLAFKLLLVALGYYLSGRLGLMLAIPPGYATAVWPASGIALAAVLLLGRRSGFGILLGSFAVNIGNGFDASSVEALLHSLPAPFAIALGATVQALVGAALIERFVGYRNLLTQELQVVWMLMLGGPLACLINATVGVGTLFTAGLIPFDNLLFNWWTWWVGDSIGVLVFAPLVLIWSLDNSSAWRRRQLTATLPLVAMFGIVVCLFVFISGREQAQLRAEFEAESQEYRTRFERDLRDDYQALHALAGFIREQDSVQRLPFERFAGTQLELLVGLRSLSWVPVVAASARAAFEADIQAQGLTAYQIKPPRGGSLLPIDSLSQHAPVAFIVPTAGNEKVLGIDNEAEVLRRTALANARLSGKPSASEAITLVQDQQTKRGMVIMLAVSNEDGSTRGYVAAAMSIDGMIEASMDGLGKEGIGLAVSERTETQPQSLIYGKHSGDEQGGLKLSLPMDVGGRNWQLDFVMPASYLLANRSWSVWLLLAGGMLFTGITGMFLLLVIGRGSRVEQLVVERTVALAKANSLLAQQVEHSQSLERETQHRAEQLAASNRELEQFAYVASHDLQAPLRNIASFARILERRYHDKLTAEANEFLAFIRESVGELQQLIDDLLSLSKVNPQSAQMLPLPLGEPLRRAREQLHAVLVETQAEISIEPLPPVRGDTRLLTQLFQNLIANAVKFQPPGQKPEIRIRASREPNGNWRCEVADNGIGIALQNQEKLFQIFRRLNASDQYPGTGIGLALCHKIVGLHGGRIWVESAPGEGSRFCFTLPSA
ncbi:MAG: CHASE domain-containing protein [Pseudomonadota bacterium]